MKSAGDIIAALPKWLARSDIEHSQNVEFLTLAISEVATALDYHLSESVLAAPAIADQSELPLPDYFCGVTQLRIGGALYRPQPLAQVMAGVQNYTYAVRGNKLVWHPAAAADKQIELYYRSLNRTSSDMLGVSVDQIGELFFRMEAVSGITETEADYLGRFPVLLDQLRYPILGGKDFAEGDLVSLDEVDYMFNAVNQLIALYPMAFFSRTMAHAWSYLQDSAREVEWLQKHAGHLEAAKANLAKRQYGRDKLAIPANGSKYNAAITRF